MLYIASFAISIGPLPHVMMSEIFPTEPARARHEHGPRSAIGEFNFVVVFAFPLMLASVGLAVTFAIFAVICVGGVFFTLARVPETTRHSLEGIEAHLKSGRPLVALRRPVTVTTAR